jgi:NitT/TauT family transport system substrate-binding protein
MYREPGKALAAVVDATKKPQDAVEYAIGLLTKNCVWSVNEGFDEKRTQWSIDNSIENGDIKPEQRPTVEQVANMALAREAVEKAGGRVTIGNCTL